jgi:Uma2 family endonuclease
LQETLGLVGKLSFRESFEMQTAHRGEYVSVDEYLAAEHASEIQHEYLGGLVYAMAGETRDHNTIALNLAQMLREKLRGGPCKVYMSGVRVNFLLRSDEYYYYPDVMVTCDSRDIDKRVVRYPKLIIEVFSQSTERIDRREKFFAYTNIASLEEYLLVSQETREITLLRRINDWRPESFTDECSVVLSSVAMSLEHARVYEGV